MRTLNNNISLLVLFIVAAIGILYFFTITYGYTMDDALITLRYSINFAEQGLPIWNKVDVSHPTMGFTSPLWMLLNSLQVHFASNKDVIVTISKYWSLIVLLFFALIVVTIINKQHVTFKLKLLFVVLLLWNPVFAFHASSGMETVLFATAIGLYAILATYWPQRYKTMIVLGLVLFFIRPEGILALGLYWLYDLVINRNFKKSFMSSIFILLILGIYFWAIYSYYGYPLPSAFYVKQGSGHLIKMSAVKMTILFLFLSASPLILMNTFAQSNTLEQKGKNFFIISLIIIYLLFYLTVEPLMNVVYRYQLPVLFLLTILAADNIEYFWKKRNSIRYSIVVFIILISIFNLGYVEKYTSKVSQASENLRKIGLFFNKYRNDKDWLIYHDAGYVCYYSDFNSIDSIGLNTIDIATKEKKVDYYLKEPNVKYYLQNGRTKNLSDINTTNISQKFGFQYVGSVPISKDSREFYIVKVYQRDGNITKKDLNSINTNLVNRTTWFDDLYYFGRKLIKNR